MFGLRSTYTNLQQKINQKVGSAILVWFSEESQSVSLHQTMSVLCVSVHN